jgi:WD40 repeat protein
MQENSWQKICYILFFNVASCNKLSKSSSISANNYQRLPNELVITGVPLITGSKPSKDAAYGSWHSLCIQQQMWAQQTFSTRFIKFDCGEAQLADSASGPYFMFASFPKLHLYIESDESLETTPLETLEISLKPRTGSLIYDVLLQMNEVCARLVFRSQTDERHLNIASNCVYPSESIAQLEGEIKKSNFQIRRQRISFSRKSLALPLPKQSTEIKSLGKVFAHSDMVNTIHLSEGNVPSLALSISSNGNLALTDLKKMSLKWVGFLTDPTPHMNQGTFSPVWQKFPIPAVISESENLLLLGGANGTVQIYDLQTGEFKNYLVNPEINAHPTVAITRSSDGKYLFFVHQNSLCNNEQVGLPIWSYYDSARKGKAPQCETQLGRLEIESKKIELKQRIDTEALIQLRYLTIDKRILLLVVSAGKISIVDADTLKEIRSLTPELLDPGLPKSFFSGADISKDGKFLAVSTPLGVAVVNLATLKPEVRLHANLGSPLTEPKFINNGSEIMAIARSGSAYRFSLEDRALNRPEISIPQSLNSNSWPNGFTIRIVPELNSFLQRTRTPLGAPVKPIQIPDPNPVNLKWINGVASFVTARPPIYPENGIEIWKYE